MLSLRRRSTPDDRTTDVADDAGFTIIEALVSFVLLAIVGAGATTVVVSGNNASKTSSDRVNAANLAQQDLQAAQSLDYPNYPAAATRTSMIGATTYTINRAVGTPCPANPAPNTNSEMLVTTTVTWLPNLPQNKVVIATEITC